MLAVNLKTCNKIINKNINSKKRKMGAIVACGRAAKESERAGNSWGKRKTKVKSFGYFFRDIIWHIVSKYCDDSGRTLRQLVHRCPVGTH